VLEKSLSHQIPAVGLGFAGGEDFVLQLDLPNFYNKKGFYLEREYIV
jgi:hypothetical protein